MDAMKPLRGTRRHSDSLRITSVDRVTGPVDLAEMVGVVPQAPDRAPLRSVTIDLTHRCPYRCAGCIEAWPMRASGGSSLRASTVQLLLRKLALAGVSELGFYGGEPTLHPAFCAILLAAAALFKRVRVVTNGSQLWHPKMVAAIRSAAKRTDLEVRVSLNSGTPRTHARLHGVDGDFERIVAGMKALAIAPSAVRLGISFLIEDANAGEIGTAVEIARDVGARYLSLRPRTGPHGVGVLPLSTAARRMAHDAVKTWCATERAKMPELRCERWLLEFLASGGLPDTAKHFRTCWYCANTRLVISPPDPGVVWACPYFRGQPRFKVADLVETPFGSDAFAQQRIATVRRIDAGADCEGVICNRHAANEFLGAGGTVQG